MTNNKRLTDFLARIQPYARPCHEMFAVPTDTRNTPYVMIPYNTLIDVFNASLPLEVGGGVEEPSSDPIADIEADFVGKYVSRYEVSVMAKPYGHDQQKTLYCVLVIGFTAHGENVGVGDEIWTDNEAKAQELVDLWCKKHPNSKVLSDIHA